MNIPSVLFLVFWLSVSLTSAQLPGTDLSKFACDDTSTYNETSAYAANLKKLLTSIVTNNQANCGFYNLTAGDISTDDRINVIALCRGDLKSSDCTNCVANAARRIQLDCPNKYEAIGWYDDCMLRYSNRSILGTMEYLPGDGIRSVGNTTSDPARFQETLGTLLRSLQATAAAEGSLKKYAQGSAKLTPLNSVFAYVQCTPDLSKQDCSRCIEMSLDFLATWSPQKLWSIIFRPSCTLRIGDNEFYKPIDDDECSSLPKPASQPSLDHATSQEKDVVNNFIRVGIPVLIGVLVTLICAVAWYMRKNNNNIDKEPESGSGGAAVKYSLKAIISATSNFSKDNKLGEGGFGSVYKGKLPNGQEVAVKRLSDESGQGDKEFRFEVKHLSELRHRNLVRLLGYCSEGLERLLIYEFMSNTSLEKFLYDNNKRKYLEWHTRVKIIMGIARGVSYLHEDASIKIIHRDLKSSNVLLDEEMNPKIADFGTARSIEMDVTHANTTQIIGTRGYMAPEYREGSRLTLKCDVYSFGVILLEIISGQKVMPNQQGEFHLLTRARKLEKSEGDLMEIVDPELGTNYSRKDVMTCINLGLECAQLDPLKRPTMASAVYTLTSISTDTSSSTASTTSSNIDDAQDLYSNNFGGSGFGNLEREPDHDHKPAYLSERHLLR